MPRQRASIRVGISETRLRRFTPLIAPGGSAASSFSPLSISGLALWFDASDATTLFTDAGSTNVASDGDAVQQWNDKSGNSTNVSQGTLANRPLYKTGILNGRSAVRFDGANDTLAGTLDHTVYGADLSKTVFVVYKGAASANVAFWYGSSGSTGVAFGVGAGATSKEELDQWGADIASTVAASTSAKVMVGLKSGDNLQLWRNGGTALAGPSAVSAANIATDTLRLSGYGALSNLLNGDVYEVLLYLGELSLTQINAVGVYLGTRWGITWSTAS